MTMTWIYAIQEGDDGPIKIGTAKNPDERLATLQCGSPTKLHGLVAYTAPTEHERVLHQVFGHLRIRGEWFQPDPLLLAFLWFMDEPFFFKEDMLPEMEALVFE